MLLKVRVLFVAVLHYLLPSVSLEMDNVLPCVKFFYLSPRSSAPFQTRNHHAYLRDLATPADIA